MEALVHFSKISKQTAVTYGNKAMCYYKLCQWRQAITECELALQIDSVGHVWVYICKALCLEQLKDYEKAYLTLQQAKRLDTEKRYMKDILPAIQRVTPFVTNASSGSV